MHEFTAQRVAPQPPTWNPIPSTAFFTAEACSKLPARISILPERVNRREPRPFASAISANLRKVAVLNLALEVPPAFTVNRWSPVSEMCSMIPAP